MSNPDIERLVDERSLIRQAFDDDQIAGYWAKAIATHRDARVEGVSAAAAFQLTYTASMQATLAVLAAHGLRVRAAANHYRAFYALQKLSPTLRAPALAFDGLRRARHESIYEPEHDEAEIENLLADARRTLDAALPAMRAAVLAFHPGLGARLEIDP